MAKEQGLSLNPTKISGSCGRLMCCLKYEQDAYEYLNSLTPGVGATVKTPEGNAVVTDANLMTGYLTVRLTDSDSMPFKIHRDDVKRLSRFKKRPTKGIRNKEFGGNISAPNSQQNSYIIIMLTANDCLPGVWVRVSGGRLCEA